ncbi:MAG TPA: flagellar motor switch protein FliN [bacterium]|nr:flagellar motor switch protein FliN [bacterium]
MAEESLPTAVQHEADDFEEDAELYSIVSPGKRQGGGGERLTSRDGEDFPFHKIEFMHDVPLRLSVEIGQTTMTVRDILGLIVGRVVEFTKVVGEPMDITVSGRLMARGEIVVVNERYGVRISEVTRPDEAGTVSYGEG